jgi:hypothetical protein
VAALTGDTEGSAMSFYDGLGNGQTHSGALYQVSLILATIKLVEDQSKFYLLDTRPAVGNAGSEKQSIHFSGYRDRSILWRVGIGVFDQPDKNIRYAIEVCPHGGKSGRNVDVNRSVAEGAFAVQKCGGNHFSHGRRRELQLEFACIEPGHFRGVANEPVQAVALFVNDGEEFALLMS